MIFTVASAFMYMRKRSLFEVFPESVKKVWNEWELRGLIMVSLILQVVLTLLGKRRKYIARNWIRFTLWSSYLMADWVATVALGVISNNSTREACGSHPDKSEVGKELMSFWAMFLLLHLGGPDTITAYSLEDNELWLRHLLGLVVQTSVAIYIFLMAWPGRTWLPVLSIPMLEASLIKYGERTWALRSANTEQLRESMLTCPDPGPNYAKFMAEFTLKKAEGFHVKADEVIEAPPVPNDRFPIPPGGRKLELTAYYLFQTFKRLFVDLILSFQERDISRDFFQRITAKEAFHVIEVELGFAYDVLYTKAPVVYTPGGCLLRLTSFLSTLSLLVAFVLVVEMHEYPITDLVITYLLLVVAVGLEVYAFILMARSDWTDHWLSKHNQSRNFLLVPCLQQPDKQWWSNSMAQYNLISFCLMREKPAACLRLLQIDKLLEKHSYNHVSLELKELVFSFFKEFRGSPTALSTQRGSFALKMFNCTEELDWSINRVEFDQSILIWHIATDLCYYMDDGENTATESSRCELETCKRISDYMLYLLVMCPSLLPIGIGLIRFQDTCAEAREFFLEGSCTISKVEACKKLIRVNTEVLPIKVKGDRSKSVLFDACRLAKFLRTKKEGKWNIASHVWVEMLAYAATHCRGNHHAQRLRKGGELLTHVWLLMAHLGITEQFQISQGHARAKLIVK